MNRERENAGGIGGTASRITRRGFVRVSAAAAAVLGGSGVSAGQDPDRAVDRAASDAEPTDTPMNMPLFVSTWPFGKPSNDVALKVFQEGGKILDAVEAGIRLAEADPENDSVGLGGIPNAEGVVQLDACIMFGPGHRAGSVAALEGILHPISAARLVMEKTPHVMLAGEDAARFARKHGLESAELLTEPRRREWMEWKSRQEAQADGASDDPANHDTIALIGLAPDGTVAGGCSTSGLAYKLPGRVGDSPILGSGLYVDNEVGAAGATGRGENVMRYCASFMIVEMMRGGMHPEDACVEAIRRIARIDPLGLDLSINFIALDKKGRFGAAGTGKGFRFAVTTPDDSRVLDSAALSDLDVGPVGGHRSR